jgi:protein-disulfide isomerase
MRRPVLTLCALALFGVAVAQLLRDSAPVGQYVGNSAAAAEMLEDDRSPATVAGAADLTVVVFVDYQCPACRAAEPAFRAAAAADGNLRIVYRDWPIFGARSENAARVALAADRQGLYGPVHDALMRAPILDDAALRRAVEDAGGNWQRLKADLARHAGEIERHLARSREAAFALGLAGTPGYLVGAWLIEGAASEREFRRAIAQVREGSR